MAIEYTPEIKKRIATAKQVLEKAKADYVQARADVFPDGRFYICRIKTHVWDTRYNKERLRDNSQFSIFWKKGSKAIGLTTSPGQGLSNYGGRQELPNWPGIYVRPYSDYYYYGGRKTTYNSLKSMLSAAKKFKLPNPLVRAFLEKYQKRVVN